MKEAIRDDKSWRQGMQYGLPGGTRTRTIRDILKTRRASSLVLLSALVDQRLVARFVPLHPILELISARKHPRASID